MRILGISSSVSVIITGILEETPDAKQPFELKAKKVEIEGECDGSYPLQKKRHSFEYLRKIAYLRPRTNTFSAVFRVRSLIAYAIHTFFQEKGFVYVHTPIITGNDCEGAGEMFSVTTMPLKNVPLTEKGEVDFSKDFFGKETNLTAKEFDLLELFMENPGKVYSREKLLDTVWGYDYPGDVRTVDVHVRRLREKIEENPSDPKYIFTKWGVGYYFRG